MCKDCKYVEKDGRRLICMCVNSESQYTHVSQYDVCDEYYPNED